MENKMNKMRFRRTEKRSRQRGSETKTAKEKEKRKKEKGSEREKSNREGNQDSCFLLCIGHKVSAMR